MRWPLAERKFCTVCGGRMIEVVTLGRQQFDPHDGRPRRSRAAYLVCANWRQGAPLTLSWEDIIEPGSHDVRVRREQDWEYES